jgi:class 3 adenylate cyclase/AmiR/NasT family two-component response regulator
MNYSKCKIVIVEDNLLFLQLLIYSIKELSKEIIIYNSDNGAEAFSLIKENKPDLIITDWDMPRLNGIELTEKIKKTHDLTYIPIIMCTGKSTPENLQCAFIAGVSDFISKPFNKIEFFARVSSQLLLSKSYQTIINQRKEISFEKDKSDKLIRNILPESIANELKCHDCVKPKLYENVTVYFSDIVGFTEMTNTIELIDLINELNDLFTVFDNIMKKNNCERIKTVGDAYIAVCGMYKKDEDHALNIINAAYEIIEFLKIRNLTNKNKWEVRTGIHTGNIIGGIIGKSKYIFDIFGDTINTTSRLEKSSKPMKILVSAKTYDIAKLKFSINKKATLNVKGIGLIDAYFLADKQITTL